MNFRPWLLASVLLALGIVNTALLVVEQVDPPEGAASVKDDFRDPLLKLRYLSSERKENLREMGLPDDLIEATMRKIARYEKQKTRIEAVMKESQDTITSVFCPSAELPERFHALRVLVKEEGKTRLVIDPSETNVFEQQEWFPTAGVPQVYQKLVLRKDATTESTVMGISALLLREENKVFENEAPFATTGFFGSGFAPVQKAYPNVTEPLVRYFSAMHLMAEIANKSDGVCN